ncbi:type II toxin-antitoxin system RelE/ParE family toxin [Pararhizobium sp. BT-229]|uniref:type II toxin-antitoxin system RelE/ParE family toxin n=1 Tax=Pararhizobium sp. BT-229 TaxID=2986923 RepID=UPI0021F7273D|nr:type II toxin-antitoxin system RelE/ParE family toxin [Pararhizobium sp. BT-229]MCV9961142.1 type II toxin-antitoxin system RelE/ParE family toxin [Pararhizobium sp. BT-229]
MSSYALTERAEDDLLALFLDGIEMFGLAQARRYKDELEHCFQLIASRPQMGRLAPSIGKGVRRHEHQSHIILYEEAEGTIVILAVVPARSIRLLKL